jgi:hypothetical protein
MYNAAYTNLINFFYDFLSQMLHFNINLEVYLFKKNSEDSFAWFVFLSIFTFLQNLDANRILILMLRYYQDKQRGNGH